MPARRGADGTWRGFGSWTEYETTEDDLRAWGGWGANVGLILGHGCIAIDGDILAPAPAARLEALVYEHLGRTPKRIGFAPKATYLFRCEQGIRYKALAVDGGKVEILARGKQTVVAGIHPKTCRPYEWPNGVPALADLPLITPAQLEKFCAALVAAFPGAGDAKVQLKGDRGDVDQNSLRGAPEFVTAAVTALPNTTELFPSFDDYVRVGYAIKASLPDDAALALDLWLQWCAKWSDDASGPGNDPEQNEADWGRMNPPFRIGASWLYEKAEALGGWTGRAEACLSSIQSGLWSTVPGSPCNPPSRPPDAPLEDVRRAVADVATTFAATISLTPADPSQRQPVVIATGTGSGKTDAALREVLTAVSRLPRKGRKASPSILYFAQQHKAASEAADRGNRIAAELGIVRADGGPIVKAYHGATQPDPDRSDMHMCRRPVELVEAARSVGCGVRSLCRNCPHHQKLAAVPEDRCAYRQQFDPEVRVWVFQHAMLSSPPPRDFRGLVPVAVVIDEAPWKTFLDELRLPASVFDAPPTLEQIRDRQRKRSARRRGKPAPDPGATHLNLTAVFAGMRDAIASVPDGPLTRDALKRAGLTPEGVHWAACTVRWLFPPPSLSGRGDNAQLLRNLDRLKRSGRARGAQLAQALEVVAATLRNDAEDAASPIRLVETDKRRTIVFGLAREIHSTWADLPTMLLDATYNPILGERWLPGVRVAAQLRVRENPEAVRRVQIYDSAFGKTSFGDPQEGDATVRYRSVERLIRILHFRARTMYVETYKDVAERLRSDLGDSPGLTVSHFGANRGVDAYGDVAVSLVVGRPLPGTYELATMAELTSGRQVDRPTSLPKDRHSAIAMRDGSGVLVSEAYHSDPFADAWKHQTANAAVEQAEGRCRAAMRKPNNPVLSLLLTNSVTNLDIDLAISREELFGAITPGAELAAIGIIPGNQADAATVLGMTHDAFRQRLSRGGAADALGRFVDVAGSGPELRPGDALDVFHMLGDPPVSAFARFRRFAYKLAAGAKPRWRHVLIDIGRHNDPRAALEIALGPLAVFEPAELPQWLAAAADVRAPDARGLVRVCGTAARFDPTEWSFREMPEGEAAQEREKSPVETFRVRGPASIRIVCCDGGSPRLSRPPKCSTKTLTIGRPAGLITLPVVASALGMPRRTVDALKLSPRVKALQREFGLSKDAAVLFEIKRRVGTDRFAAAVAKLTAEAT